MKLELDLDLELGQYSVSLATDVHTLQQAQRLRHRAFRRNNADGLDRDRFDDLCHHVVVHHRDSAQMVGCFRVMISASAAEITQSYSAQYYDLTNLRKYAGPVAELGRLCVDSGTGDIDVLRAAWAGLAHIVDHHRINLLFGCASFQGTDPRPYHDCFRLLHHNHAAPAAFAPRIKSPDVVEYATLSAGKIDPKRALTSMPALLRTYMLMGGWVSDHAVIDYDMNTLHVFTAVEINKIPPARQRLLRAMA